MRIKKSIKMYVLILCCLMVLTGCMKNVETVSANQGQNVKSQNLLKIHFLNVGQADCILIQGQNKNMLIDAGNNEDSDFVVDYLKKENIQTLDYVIGTHPHEDHIGGLDKVIDTFHIGKVYMPKVVHTSKTFEDVIESIEHKNLKISTPHVGEKLDLGEAHAQILAPNNSQYKDFNNYSIVMKMVFLNTSFLFTGDAEDVSEKEMLQKGVDVSADVLKVGHHGSHSSTTDEFLHKVHPKYAVIMTQRGNDYHHPHRETMEKLKSNHISVYRTDESGTIIAISDGENIKWNTQPGDYAWGEKDNASKDIHKEYKKRTDASIKGNINSKGEKIYHIKGGTYYDSVKAERWFKTEEEAQKAGYRKSKR